VGLSEAQDQQANQGGATERDKATIMLRHTRQETEGKAGITGSKPATWNKGNMSCTDRKNATAVLPLGGDSLKSLG
jgi:hypothetical protein